jgi:hypothetical protein
VSTRLELDGLEQLKRDLRNLPDELVGEAQHIVEATANGAASAIKHAYPSHSGNLIARVDVEGSANPHGAGAKVISRARHSHLFEFGTKSRKTANGANRGQMPKARSDQAMIPIAIRARRLMVSKLIDLVKRAGFTVETNG